MRFLALSSALEYNRINEASRNRRIRKQMGYILLLILSVVQGLCPCLMKKFVKDTENIPNAKNVYMLLIYPLATIYYFILAGGDTPLNLPTFWFSLVFGLVGVGSTVLHIIGYRYASLIYMSVFNGAGATLVPFLFELLLGRESFSTSEILSVLFRLVAVCVPLLAFKKKDQNTKTGIFICMLLFLIGGAVNVIYKLYGENPSVASDQSFCFWTNVVTLPFIILIILKQTKLKTLIASGRKIKKIDYACVIGSMMIGNLCTLVSIHILRMLSATAYSILNSSLVLVVTVIVSITLYKEKLTKETVFSVIFSILAIIFGVL